MGLLHGSNGSVGFVARFWFVSMFVASMVHLARWFGGSWFEVVDVCGVGLWFWWFGWFRGSVLLQVLVRGCCFVGFVWFVACSLGGSLLSVDRLVRWWCV